MTHPFLHLDDLLRRLPQLQRCRGELLAAFELLLSCFRAEGKLLLCGNGGSAADCAHWSAELLKGVQSPRPLNAASRARLSPVLADGLQQGLPAIPLPSLVALNTAFANDVDPQLAFAQGVWALGRPGEVLAAISTSGRSRSVLLAAEAALSRGLRVLGLTGSGGEGLRAVATVCISVPAAQPWAVQELHLPVYHCLSSMLDVALFPPSWGEP